MRTVVVLVVLVSLAACGSGEGGAVLERPSDGRYERIGVDDVSTWRHTASSGDGLEALIDGVLGHDPECGVWIHQPEVDVRYPVVWPAATTIERADPLTLRLPDGTAVAVGDLVSGAGGYLHLELVEAGCADTGETAVFNAAEDVEVDVRISPSGPSEGRAEPSPSPEGIVAAALPEAARLLAELVGEDVAVDIHGYGRCRGEEAPPGPSLFGTLRSGEWTSRSGQDAHDWVADAVEYPLPDTGERTYVLAFDDPARPDLIVTAATFEALGRGLDVDATVHVGRIAGDVSPTQPAVILEFDDGLVASVASCGFVDDVGPIYALLAADERPMTDAATVLEELIAQADGALLDRLDPEAEEEPRPITTPSAPDGRVDLDIHPSGQSLARATVAVTLPLSWQELGGTICASVPQGFSGCLPVRALARGEPVQVAVRVDPAADMSLVWSPQPVGPAFDPVTLGTTSPRCDVVLTATVEQAIADPDTLRAAIRAGAVVTWAHEPYPPPPQADPTGTPTHAPPPPAAC